MGGTLHIPVDPLASAPFPNTFRPLIGGLGFATTKGSCTLRINLYPGPGPNPTDICTLSILARALIPF